MRIKAVSPGIGSLVKPLHSEQALFALSLSRNAVSSLQRPDLGLAVIGTVMKSAIESSKPIGIKG